MEKIILITALTVLFFQSIKLITWLKVFDQRCTYTLEFTNVLKLLTAPSVWVVIYYLN